VFFSAVYAPCATVLGLVTILVLLLDVNNAFDLIVIACKHMLRYFSVTGQQYPWTHFALHVFRPVGDSWCNWFQGKNIGEFSVGSYCDLTTVMESRA